MKFQAITKDQAAVSFSALIVYSVKDATEETLKNVSFLFSDHDAFVIALTKKIESLARTLIAEKLQQEVLGLRQEIITYIQEHIKEQTDKWGYSLHDVTINDIKFADAVMASMDKVVASKNLLAAATNEGDALKIKFTKEAEAKGEALMIQARAEKEAETLRGQGVASFRFEIAKGLHQSAEAISADDAKLSGQQAIDLIGLSMWLESMKMIAENNDGNMFMNFDASPTGMEKYFQTTVIKNGKAEKN